MQVEHFAVNILGLGEQEISRRLSRKGQSALQPDEFSKGTHGAPLLNDAAAIFECVVHERIEAGDHVIFLGRVLGCSHNSHETPLLYYRGAYRALGPKS
jgi:flavin reductase (DIM6/NTAB) family NADH-FMN oxidoreductase RutF